MTGSAKQSIASRRKNGLLRRCAPRSDVKSRYASAFPRREAPEVLQNRSPRKTEGAGNAGRPTRPQPRVRCEMAHECSHHGHTGITRHSPRNGFTAYIVLSPATSSCCHRHPRIKGSSNPVELDFASANLAPATGARTTRFYRTQKAPIILHAS